LCKHKYYVYCLFLSLLFNHCCCASESLLLKFCRECPLDLKEAISSVCFAAPRCSDLTELQQVQILFVSKYGKEFVAAASELKPDSGVNRKVISEFIGGIT